MSSEKPVSQRERRTVYLSAPLDLVARVDDVRRRRAVGTRLPSRALVLLAALDAGLSALESAQEVRT